MKYNINHKTIYDYGTTVNICHSIAYLTPRNLPYQKVLNFELDIDPVDVNIEAREDFYGNIANSFSVQIPHEKLVVLSKSIVEVHQKTIQLSIEPNITCANVVDMLKSDLDLRAELLDFMIPSAYIKWDDEIKAFAQTCWQDNMPLHEYVQALCGKIFTEFKFDSSFSTIYTPVKTVLKEKRGVCQDFSHLAIASFRSMGLAARYVSGYLETLPPPGKPKLQGSDASHAWVSVYIPNEGWFDFDPTNNMPQTERHITIGWGRDYADVPPLKGIVFNSGVQSLKVEVDVIPCE